VEDDAFRAGAKAEAEAANEAIKAAATVFMVNCIIMFQGLATRQDDLVERISIRYVSRSFALQQEGAHAT
jgi:hypothetical protein